jgi:hypothetical protein
VTVHFTPSGRRLGRSRSDDGDSGLIPSAGRAFRSQGLMNLAVSVRIRAPSTPKILPRPKPNFPSPSNPITPVQISRQKYSALRFPQISRTLSGIPPHAEGRFAIVTNVEAGCGGRDGSRACLAPTNELIRLLWESRRDRYQARCTGSRAGLSRTAKPCGPGAPTLALNS